MNKYPLIGGIILAVVLLVLASLSNVVGYHTVIVSNNPFNLKLDIITYKQRFPRIYLDGSYFNATIILTNIGSDTFNEFNLTVLLSQTFPAPRVPNEYEDIEINLSLEPNESYILNFSCEPILSAMGHFGIFPLEIYVRHDGETVKLRHMIFIIFDPIFEHLIMYSK